MFRSFQKFGTLTLVILFLLLIDQVFSVYSDEWISPARKRDRDNAWEARPGIEGWRRIDLSGLSLKIRHFKDRKIADPDSVRILFLGNSTADAGIDTDRVDKLLTEKFPGEGFRSEIFWLPGIKFFEGLAMLAQVADKNLDVCVYGLSYCDFIRYPDRPEKSLILKTLGRKPPTKGSFSIRNTGSYVDKSLHRYSALYRSRQSLQETLYSNVMALYKSNSFLRKSLIKDGESNPKALQERWWNEWRQTGDLQGYGQYIKSLRGDQYLMTFLAPPSTIYTDKNIDKNFRDLDDFVRLCRQHHIVPVVLHLPINPILKRFGANDTQKFVASRLEPFCAEHDIIFCDLSGHSKEEYFNDFNHLNHEGKQDLSPHLAHRLGDAIASEIFMPRNGTDQNISGE